MKAALFSSPGRPLVIADVSELEPGQGEVLLQVAKCGICGTDLQRTAGRGIPLSPGRLGHEFAGTVLALGPGVERLKLGDRISALPMASCGQCPSCLDGLFFWCKNGLRSMTGGFAERTLVHERSAHLLPATLTFADGALVEPLACSLNGVSKAKIRQGSRILVIGAGAIGLGVVYWARRLSGGPIAVTARSTHRRQLALDMGASAFVQSGADTDARICEALGGPPDYVFECSGSPGMLAKAVDHVAAQGTVVVLGLCTGLDTLSPSAAMYKQVEIKFAVTYANDHFRQAIDTMDAGHVEPRAMIAETISLAELPDTFEALRSDSTRCRVHVDPSADLSA